MKRKISSDQIGKPLGEVSTKPVKRERDCDIKVVCDETNDTLKDQKAGRLNVDILSRKTVNS